MDQHKLIHRQLEVEKSIVNEEMTPKNSKRFEKILQQRSEGLAFADNKCRKLKCRKVPYSPEFDMATTKIEVWKAAQTIKRGCKFSFRLFRRLQDKAGLKQCLRKTNQEMQEEEKKAWKEYWSIKKRADILQKSFLTQKAEAIAQESETQTTANV